MYKSRLTKQGNSTGLIVPAELLQEKGLHRGDEVVLSPTEDGFAVKRPAADMEEGLEALDRFVGQYDRAMKELAK